MIINLKHDTLISFRPRRLSFWEKTELRKILDKFLNDKIIRQSTFSYVSPIVLTKKKNGELKGYALISERLIRFV